MKKHNITEHEYSQVIELSRRNKLKRIDKRLQVIILRYEGMKDKDIAAKGLVSFVPILNAWVLKNTQGTNMGAIIKLLTPKRRQKSLIDL